MIPKQFKRNTSFKIKKHKMWSVTWRNVCFYCKLYMLYIFFTLGVYCSILQVKLQYFLQCTKQGLTFSQIIFHKQTRDLQKIDC